MGKNNRQRRAVKAKARRSSAARQRPHRHRNTWHAEGPAPSAADLFVLGVRAAEAGDRASAALLAGRLAQLEPRPPVARTVAGYLEDHLADLWRHGWQPADVDRIVRRGLSPAEAAVAVAAITAQSRAYRDLGARVAPEWMAQVAALGAAEPDAGQGAYLQACGDWATTLEAAVALMGLLVQLPELPVLTDPPERWVEGMATAGGALPASVLDKVRGLLAKAESTTFAAEAEACTAKAQELMARHRIDRAVLDAHRREPHEPAVGRRIGVEDPYADARAALLAGIASVNGCHAVWSRRLGFSTVFGVPADLDATEELFTSLLVQATVALRREGSKHDRHGRSRTTRFRRSFLVAFAQRITVRLHDTVAATVAEAEDATGAALLPVLAAAQARVDEAVAAAFPEMDAFSPSATDGEGWFAGTLFAEQADLSAGPPLEARQAG